MTTARSRSKRPAKNWVLIPPSGFERLTEKARAFQAVAPRLFDRLGDADARSGDNLHLALARKERERRRVEGQAVLVVGDPQRLADPAGPGAEQPHVDDATPAAHDREPLSRLDGPDQHRAGRALWLADEVHAPVDAVGAVDIDVAGRAEHHRIAGRGAAKTVRCGIGLVVGLDLDDAAADAVNQQRHPDQVGRYLMHAASEKGAGQSFGHRAMVAVRAALGKSRLNA